MQLREQFNSDKGDDILYWWQIYFPSTFWFTLKLQEAASSPCIHKNTKPNHYLQAAAAWTLTLSKL